jgi:hypothetical protein
VRRYDGPTLSLQKRHLAKLTGVISDVLQYGFSFRFDWTPAWKPGMSKDETELWKQFCEHAAQGNAARLLEIVSCIEELIEAKKKGVLLNSDGKPLDRTADRRKRKAEDNPRNPRPRANTNGLTVAGEAKPRLN